MAGAGAAGRNQVSANTEPRSLCDVAAIVVLCAIAAGLAWVITELWAGRAIQ